MSRRLPVMTEEEFRAMMRDVLHDELRKGGLRLDTDDHADASAKDMAFLRSFREGVAGVSAKIGMAVIMAILSGLMLATWTGFKAIAGK